MCPYQYLSGGERYGYIIVFWIRSENDLKNDENEGDKKWKRIQQD